MKVGIYARCSTDESRQDINNQLQCQKDWCKSKNYEYKVYQDYISSYLKPEGPQLKQLKKDVAIKKINLVSVYKLDRLTRKGIVHGFNLIQYFRDHGANIRSHTEEFLNPEYPEWVQEIITSVMLWASKLESAKTSERIKTTYQTKKANAEKNGDKLNWGRKKGSYQFDIDINDLKQFLSNNPDAGYGSIARRYPYFDKNKKTQKIPSRSAIKDRLETLGVRKIVNKDSKGNLISKWVFRKSGD